MFGPNRVKTALALLAVLSLSGTNTGFTQIAQTNSVDLELTYPVGNSPQVFTQGWVFDATCMLRRSSQENPTDCSDDVQWSGTGSFAPENGRRTKPRFTTPGPNSITLSIEVDGQRHERSFPISAVAPEPYAKVGDRVSCWDNLAFGMQMPAQIPGVITSGSDLVHIGGRPAARVGDMALVAVDGPNEAEIMSGDPNVLIEGRPAARVGDRIRCSTGPGSIGVAAPGPERRLPDPVTVTLQAKRGKLPEPHLIILEARRQKLPDPVELTLEVRRGYLPEPAEITLSTTRTGLPEAARITLQATRPAVLLVAVPPVLKKPLKQAIEDVGEAGLSPAPALGDAPKKRDQLPGHVYATDPAVGDKIAPGSPVTLTAYGERPKRPVPDIAGMKPDAAAGILAESDFVAGKSVLGDPAPDEEHVGLAQGSNPAAGRLREIFSTVQPIIYGPVADEPASDNDGLKVVPPLAGLSIEAANARLRQVGLVPGLPTLGKPAPANVQPGTVSGSSPPAGEIVEANTVVLPVVWGLHTADTPEVNVAELEPEPWEDEDDEPEQPQDPYFQFPEPEFTESGPEPTPAPEIRQESGWGGLWVCKMTILPQRSAHFESEFEILDEPGGTFMKLINDPFGNDKHHPVRLSGDTMSFVVPPVVGTPRNWEIQRSGGNYSARLHYAGSSGTIHYIGTCRRQ